MVERDAWWRRGFFSSSVVCYMLMLHLNQPGPPQRTGRVLTGCPTQEYMKRAALLPGFWTPSQILWILPSFSIFILTHTLTLDNGLLMMNIKNIQSSPNPNRAILVMDCIKSYFVVRRVPSTHYQAPLTSASVKSSQTEQKKSWKSNDRDINYIFKLMGYLFLILNTAV